MKTTRLIATFLCLSLLFSNMAWAMDECSLTTEFFTQTIDSVNLNTDPGTTDTTFSERNVIDNSSGNGCDTLCAGWTHLNYISYKTPIINAIKTHNDIAPLSFIYHFSLRKPPTEPPKV